MTEVTYKTWSEVPDGTVLRDAHGNIAVRNGKHWGWLKTFGRWRDEVDWHPLHLFKTLAATEPAEELGQVSLPVDPSAVRALVEAYEEREREPRPGDRLGEWEDVPTGGVVIDRVGDVARKDAEGRRRWPRVRGRWMEAFPDTEVRAGDFGPYTYVGLAADEDAARALVQQHEGLLKPGPRPGDAIPPKLEAWRALPPGTLTRLPKDEAVNDEEFGLVLVGREEYCRYRYRDRRGRDSGVAEPWLYDREALVVALGVGTGVDDVRAAIAAADPALLGFAPQRPKVGDPVGPEDWDRLPVGTVVDVRDGTRAPLLVRGPAGWGWGNCCRSEPRFDDSPGWGQGASAKTVCRANDVSRAVVIALGVPPDTRGPAFDRALAAQGYQPAIDGLRAQAQARPLSIGDEVREWADLPDGGVAEDAAGDLCVRVGQRRDWVRLSQRWQRQGAQQLQGGRGLFHLSDGKPCNGTRLIAVVPAPVTLERIRAAVGDPAPEQTAPTGASAPEGPAPDLQALAQRARERRKAGLERALAAAEARWRELEPTWTVTRSGGITFRNGGRKSLVAGVICRMEDMPGATREAKRAEAKRRVAERGEQRALARSEFERLRALVDRHRAPPERVAVVVDGEHYEVPAHVSGRYSIPHDCLAAPLVRARLPVEVVEVP